MHSLTFITWAGPNPVLRTVTHPNRDTLGALYWSMVQAGFTVRAWNPDGKPMF